MLNRMPEMPELLAPAGDWESLRAAVANGADAVYFGLEAFNARARATNFTLEELPRVMQYLHRRNVRGFVTLNILIFSDELVSVEQIIHRCAASGVDAVIVQDLGLVRLVRAVAPTLPVHASTQMTLTEVRGLKFVQDLGVERAVLARELSLRDIERITSEVDLPVEVFVHGALCVAYSGQCLTSEALGGRSANRGQCAQACRLPYELLVDGESRELGDRAYLLSPQDLAAIDMMPELVRAGVISFKIEGRLKGGPYVAATTQAYRKALDAALQSQRYQPTRREQLDLAQVFSRGLTPGYLEGVNHQRLVRGRFPKSRGIQLGSVVGFTQRGVLVRLAERLPNFVQPGDGVLFDLGTPELQEPAGRIWQITPKSADDVELCFADRAIDFSKIPLGCTIWKTDDPTLKKKLEQSYSQDRLHRRLSVQAELVGQLGGTLKLTLTAPCQSVGVATWPGPLEPARNRPTTTEELREQLSRLGDTPLTLGELRCDLPDHVMIPRSVLNDLRREAVQQLLTARDQKFIHPVVRSNALAELRASLLPRPSLEAVRWSVLVRNLEQLQAVLAWPPPEAGHKPALVYCDFEDLRRYKEAVTLARQAGVPIGLAALRIWKPGEEGFQSLIVRAEPDAVLVRNLASIGYFREHLPNAQLIGDFSLNVANELTADLLWQRGVERLVPSFDLNWDQFRALMRQSSPSGYEVVIHQHMPMFHNEFCVFAAFLSTGKDHTDCGRPCERHQLELRDRVGSRFPVLPDTGCRNTVFNSVPQSAAEYVRRMKDLGLRWFRVDLLRESGEDVTRLLNQYARVIFGQDDGQQTWRELKALNQLGVTRGTLNLL